MNKRGKHLKHTESKVSNSNTPQEQNHQKCFTTCSSSYRELKTSQTPRFPSRSSSSSSFQYLTPSPIFQSESHDHAPYFVDRGHGAQKPPTSYGAFKPLQQDAESGPGSWMVLPSASCYHSSYSHYQTLRDSSFLPNPQYRPSDSQYQSVLN